jgi:hypothetical protein
VNAEPGATGPESKAGRLPLRVALEVAVWGKLPLWTHWTFELVGTLKMLGSNLQVTFPGEQDPVSNHWTWNVGFGGGGTKNPHACGVYCAGLAVQDWLAFRNPERL